MRKLFDIDSPVWKWMGRVCDLVVLNLLFIVTSLPIVTIGTSLSSLWAVECKCYERKTDTPVRDYWKAWKENFKGSTVIWLAYLLFAVAMVFSLNIIRQVNISGKPALLILFGAILFIMTMTTVYALAMQGRFQNSLSDTIVKGFLTSLSGLPYTLVMGLMIVASVLVTFQSVRSILFAIPFWLLFGFSGIGYLCSLMFLRVFRKITCASDLGEDPLREKAGL